MFHARCDPRLTGPDRVELEQFLGDLHGVGGGALAEVVADAPEEQGVGAVQVLADPADEDVVAAGGGGGQGITSSAGVVEDDQAGGVRPEVAGLLGGDRPLGLDQDRLAVAVEDRDPHAGRADVDRVVAHDLAGLVDHLHLFLGVPVRAGSRRSGGCS